MTNREYIKTQIDILPEIAIERLQEYIVFQKFNLGLFDNDTDYLNSIPGMTEKIMEARKTPVSECLEI